MSLTSFLEGVGLKSRETTLKNGGTFILSKEKPVVHIGREPKNRLGRNGINNNARAINVTHPDLDVNSKESFLSTHALTLSFVQIGQNSGVQVEATTDSNRIAVKNADGTLTYIPKGKPYNPLAPEHRFNQIPSIIILTSAGKNDVVLDPIQRGGTGAEYQVQIVPKNR